MFSTTAKNLTSSSRFSWRPEQNQIFMDWITVKGPNAMSADMVPLLRALDLDGYEDIDNNLGDCVHDIIIVKVRRKISNTKGLIIEKEREQREGERAKEKEKEREKQKQKQKEKDKEREQYQSYIPITESQLYFNPHGPSSRNSDEKKTVVKHEPKDDVTLLPSIDHTLCDYGPPTNYSFSSGRYDFPFTSAFVPEFYAPHTTAPESQFSGYTNQMRPRALEKEVPTAKILSPPASPSPSTTSIDRVVADPARLSKTTYPTAYPPQGRPQTQTQKPKRAPPAPSVSSNLPPYKASDKPAKANKLMTYLCKVQAAMEDLSIEIRRLPKDSETADLETAAHDTVIEIGYLESLVLGYTLANAE